MLDSFFTKSFKSSKCRTLLRLTIPRIKLLRNRREIQIKQMRREIAKLLETGQEASARIRVENILREEKMMAAQEMVELFCELITARLPIIDAQKECPLDLKEAISSVCFAAPRCADLPELHEVQTLFAGKYGKEFVSSATELMPECGVNRQLVDLLSVRAPSPDVKLKLLKEIAKEHELDWDPSDSENDLLKSHEDLLDEPTQFVSDPRPRAPFTNTHNDEAKSTTSQSAVGEHPDSDEDFDIIDLPEVPMQQPLQSNKAMNEEANMSWVKVNHSQLELGVCLGLTPKTEEDAERKISNCQAQDRQFVPFIRPPPPSQLPEPFHVEENGSIPSVTKTIDDQADFQDVLAAAEAAAETAEGAAAAARSACSLAELRITELMKKENEDFSYCESENPFHLDKTKTELKEEVELDAENLFAHSDTPFTSPGGNSASEHSSVDAKGVFDSYSESDNAFSYSSLNRTQPLSPTDDDMDFSYPNLFTSQGSK
ncbi:IST1 isoform X1 [Salvia divinorum]|uniref:IST1 isoform X1 n=1 Tax=Salvia divinorum TaxID=28513 RepID=A0ABD1FZ35_SALDI